VPLESSRLIKSFNGKSQATVFASTDVNGLLDKREGDPRDSG
jgi:hypothetical protein